MHHKFDINDTSSILLEVKQTLGSKGLRGCTRRGRRGTQVIAHFLPHDDHLTRQSFFITLGTQDLGTQCCKAFGQPLTANQGPRANQRLMLPGPGFVTLIARKRGQRADQQARVTRGTQAHVDLVQRARHGLGVEHMNDALAQAGKELAALNGPGAVGFRLRIAVVDKYQIQIRAMPQFDPANLAVTHHNEVHLAARTIGARRLAMPRNHFSPRQLEHLLQNRFGNPGQIVTDLHQRQRTGNLGRRYPQYVCALEVAQRFHLLFQVILGNAQQLLA